MTNIEEAVRALSAAREALTGRRIEVVACGRCAGRGWHRGYTGLGGAMKCDRCDGTGREEVDLTPRRRQGGAA